LHDTLDTPIVPGLFIRQSVNLLVGHGGAGKTKLILNNLNHYIEGRGFLGYGLGPEALPIIPENAQALLDPEQVGMICCTQSLRTWKKKFQPYPSLAKHCPLVVLSRTMNIETLIEAYKELRSFCARSVRFLVIEGIQHLIGQQKYSDPFPVRDLYISLQAFCEEYDVTILGTVGSPKANMLTNYPRLGDKIYGGITWGQETELLIGIEELNENASLRRIVIRHRDAMRRILYADFDAESILHLVEREEGVPEGTPSEQKLAECLAAAASGDELTWDLFYDWGTKVGVSKATVKRWVGKQAKGVHLEKVGNTRPTTYKKPFVQ
jgi:AAA domain